MAVVISSFFNIYLYICVSQWIFFSREVVKPKFLYFQVSLTQTLTIGTGGRIIALSVINFSSFFPLNFVYVSICQNEKPWIRTDYLLLFKLMMVVVVVCVCVLFSCCCCYIFFFLLAQEHLSKRKYDEIKTMKYNSLIFICVAIHILCTYTYIYKRVVAARTQSFNHRKSVYLKKKKAFVHFGSVVRCFVWVQNANFS